MSSFPMGSRGQVRSLAGAAGASCLILVIGLLPFRFAGLGWAGPWLLPVVFQAGWCLVEGWHAIRFRGEVPTGSEPELGLPMLTGLVALGIAGIVYVESFLRAWGSGDGSTPGLVLSIGGLLTGTAGVLLRQAAIRRLGNRFRDDVALGAIHPLERGGVYARMDHPGELGFGIAMLGLVLMGGSISALLVYLVLLVPLMGVRVRREDRMLASARTPAAPTRG